MRQRETARLAVWRLGPPLAPSPAIPFPLPFQPVPVRSIYVILQVGRPARKFPHFFPRHSFVHARLFQSPA